MKVLVTGGAGFIGSHLVERLVATGAGEVAVLDDLSIGSADNLGAVATSVELLTGDVCDPNAATAAAEAELVFHLAVHNVRASLRDPLENLRVNAFGTLQILEAMRHGRRGELVYVSSSEIYGVPPSGRFSEDTLPAPTTVYGAAKLAGEQFALAYHKTFGMKTRVIRPFNTYGPRSHFEGDSAEVIPRFILRALRDLPLIVHGDGHQTRDFMYVGDTARLLIDLAQRGGLVGEVVNIGTGRETRIIDLAEMIIEATGSASDIKLGEPRPGDLPRLRADTTKARLIAPFNLETSLEDGLKATIQYFEAGDVDAMLAMEVPRSWK